eukprot:1142075-Pelagomonas_calceolata.AAC.2
MAVPPHAGACSTLVCPMVKEEIGADGWPGQGKWGDNKEEKLGVVSNSCQQHKHEHQDGHPAKRGTGRQGAAGTGSPLPLQWPPIGIHLLIYYRDLV